MKITILPVRETVGWDGTAAVGELDPCPVVDLRAGLEAEYPTDAHFCPYYVVGAGGEVEPEIPRLNKGALDAVRASGGRVLFGVAVLDVDCPEAHAVGGEAPEAWREAQEARIDALPRELGGAGWYETRGGYRLLWTLPEPLEVEPYLGLLAGLVVELRRHGIEADEGTIKDWNRCYRLPRVRRDGVDQRRHVDLSWMDRPLAWRSVGGAAARKALEGIGAVRVGPVKAPERIEKNRNVTLMSLAGAMRRNGLDEEEIAAALSVVNAGRCVPPLDEAEVAEIAAKVCRYRPSAPVLPTEGEGGEDAAPGALPGTAGPRLGGGADARDEVGKQAAGILPFDDEVVYADHIITKLEEEGGPLVYTRSDLWQYEAGTGLWAELPRSRIDAEVARLSGQWVLTAKDKSRQIRVTYGLAKSIRAWICSSRESDRWFDEAPDGLAFTNGFVRFGGASLTHEPLTPEHRANVRMEWPYLGRGCEPPRFLAFLRSCFEGDDDAEQKVQFLREFIGVCLLGKATAFERGLILKGSGANGKSTFQNIVRELFRGRMVTAVPPQDMGQEYRLAMLAGSRINIVSDMQDAPITNTGTVKAILSGDEVTARNIREAPFKFRPKTGHILSLNGLPTVKDTDRGFWRKWVVIPWNRSFEGIGRVGLAQEIIDTELPVITAWALDQAEVALNRGSLKVPPSADEALREWLVGASSAAAFIETLEKPDDHWEDATNVYQAFRVWCQRNGYEPMNSTAFGKRVKELVVWRKNNTVQYRVKTTAGPALRLLK